MTSSYCSTVLSPPLGVQWAATQLRLQPVGKAMPGAAGRQQQQQQTAQLTGLQHITLVGTLDITQVSLLWVSMQRHKL
jgi:hypothetical protein